MFDWVLNRPLMLCVNKLCEAHYLKAATNYLAFQNPFQQFHLVNLNPFNSVLGNDRLVAESKFEVRKHHGHCQSNFGSFRSNFKLHSKLYLSYVITEITRKLAKNY